MAQYKVTHSCGHQQNIHLMGMPEKKRQWIVSDKATRPCPDCQVSGVRVVQASMQIDVDLLDAIVNSRPDY